MYGKNKNFINLFFKINLVLIVYKGQVLSIDQSVCGDWETFKDEKCFKIFDKEDLQKNENALKSCSQLGKDSSLLTISSKEEQDFVSDFIFNKNKIKENVWLGGKRVNGSSFKWSDNSDVKYTNWAENSPTKELDRECIEMKSEYGFYSYESLKGKWINVPCDKKGVVVCQKMQNWSISVLQKQLLKAEKNLEELTKRLMSNENKFNELENSNKQMNISLRNIIPIGFVYTQLPHNKPPQEIWPQMKWNDISSEYANVFFRVIGNGSESFGKIQEENAPMLTSVKSAYNDGNIKEGNKIFPDNVDASCPKNGWSDWLYTGSADGTARYTRFFNSGGEVRPINIAIKLWQRIN